MSRSPRSARSSRSDRSSRPARSTRSIDKRTVDENVRKSPGNNTNTDANANTNSNTNASPRPAKTRGTFPTERYPSPPSDIYSPSPSGHQGSPSPSASPAPAPAPIVAFTYPPTAPLSPSDPLWLTKMLTDLERQHHDVRSELEEARREAADALAEVTIAQGELDTEVESMQAVLELLAKIAGPEFVAQIIRDADEAGGNKTTESRNKSVSSAPSSPNPRKRSRDTPSDSDSDSEGDGGSDSGQDRPKNPHQEVFAEEQATHPAKTTKSDKNADEKEEGRSPKRRRSSANPSPSPGPSDVPRPRGRPLGPSEPVMFFDFSNERPASTHSTSSGSSRDESDSEEGREDGDTSSQPEIAPPKVEPTTASQPAPAPAPQAESSSSEPQPDSEPQSQTQPEAGPSQHRPRPLRRERERVRQTASGNFEIYIPELEPEYIESLEEDPCIWSQEHEPPTYYPDYEDELWCIKTYAGFDSGPRFGSKPEFPQNYWGYQ